MADAQAQFDRVAREIKKRVEKVISRMKRMDGMSVSVGIDPAARYPNGKPVTEVAELVEYGTRYMEPRPFMRTAKEENYESWRGILRRGIAKAAKTGESPVGEFQRAADKMKSDVQESIMDYAAYRTGRLYNSVIARVNGEVA